MTNKAKFFDYLRDTNVLGPVLTRDEVAGCEAILDATEGWTPAWRAYALATAYHETAGTMQPIAEYGTNSYFTTMYDIRGRRPTMAKSMGNTTPGDGIKYRGRGYVQLTWKNNYAKAGKALGIDLVKNPDYALDERIAARIMREGMEHGWFTGLSLKTYLKNCFGTAAEFTLARKIINGNDKASLIAGYALTFQKAMLE